MSVLDIFKLDGKTALVTGCSRGIGYAMAIALAEAGADIVGVSHSLKVPGSLIETAVTAIGRTFTGFTCDFAERQAVYDFIHDVKAQHTIDILVNNAGIAIRNFVVDYTDEDWDRVIEVNLNTQFILSREFGREMVKRRAGKIIFMASLLTYQGGLTVPAYSASKGAIGQLTKALSNEWAKHNVQVNAIVPGYVATDMNTALINDPVRSRQILERIPAGRWGKSEDFAGAIIFLASSASDYINGSSLIVDGGWMGR